MRRSLLSRIRPSQRGSKRSTLLLVDWLEQRVALAANPAISISDVAILEGNSGTANATFTVSLSNPSPKRISVDYATSGGTAVAGVDFLASSGILTFAKGETSRTITVPIVGDTLNEASESFFVDLSAPTMKATIGKGRGVGTILNDDPPPTITIGDATLIEGDSGSTLATFNVSLSAPSGQTVQVGYSTANGTAVAGSDYLSTSGTLAFAPGQTSLNVVVPVLGDTLDEEDETFFVNLSDASNADIANAQGLGTINDDDPEPSFSISDAVATESESGSVVATFFITLSAPSGRPVTVDVNTADGTATGGKDYLPLSHTFTFAPGQTSQTINLPIGRDLLDEDDETFTVNLSNPTNASISDAQGVGTILDNDPLPTVIINDRAISESQSGTMPVVFNVALTAPSGRPVTIAYSTADGTATAGLDYVPTSGTLTFAPGQTVLTVAVPILGDTLDEESETFFLNLSDPANAVIADAQGLARIDDDDSAPTLSIDNLSVAIQEGNTGTQAAAFNVSLSAPSGRVVTVAYTTPISGTATANSDYTPMTGVLTFLPGTTSQTISVPVLGDTLDEPNETFFVQLSSPINALIVAGAGQGIVTILDDDNPPPPPSLSINDATVTESAAGSTNAQFTVTLSAASDQVVTVAYFTADDSATAGSDYGSLSGTLTFLPGQTSQTISVPVSDDTIDENDETFFLRLGSPIDATIADGQGIGTIIDDDASPTISIADVTVTEGDSGKSYTLFNVTLSAPSGQVVTVHFTTSNNSTTNRPATAGSDYLAISGNVTFLPGQTSQSISVPLLGDTRDEPDETFLVLLSSPLNATIADNQAVGTILDDDPTPSLSISDATVIEGDPNARFAVFTVTLSAASNEYVGFSYTTANGTATAGADYGSTGGNVTFLPGQTSQTISVPIIDDNVEEPDESFSLLLIQPGNATIADGQGVGTILDNDPIPTLSVSDARVVEGDLSAPNAIFTVTLSAPSKLTVTVAYSTANSSATAGSDYTATSGTLIFLPGETSKTISVPILDDAISEADQSFFLRLSSPVSATIAGGQGVGTIVDNDPQPTISISDASAMEADTTTNAAFFMVTLSAPSQQVVTVAFNTADGTAVAGSDYGSLSGTLTFQPGQTSKTIGVPVLADSLDEPDESFFLRLGTATNAVVADGEGLATILDNDTTPNPTFAIQDASIVEGDSGTKLLQFKVTLSVPSANLEWVVFTTADGTATAEDYTPQRQDYGITFLAGVTEQTISIPILGDTAVEEDEVFYVNLIRGSRIITDNQAVGTILNDDDAGV